jgi:hypothetical protein
LSYSQWRLRKEIALVGPISLFGGRRERLNEKWVVLKVWETWLEFTGRRMWECDQQYQIRGMDYDKFLVLILLLIF